MKDSNGDEKRVWTILALKEHLEKLLAEYKQSVSDALIIRTSETDRRLAILNNHAERVDEIMEKCLPRSEYRIYHDQLEKEVRELQKFKIIMDTKASQTSVNWSFAVSTITTIIAIIALVHELTTK